MSQKHTRFTKRQVEEAILGRFGMSVRLHRDSSGYYYFYSDDDNTDLELNRWPSTSVYVYRLNQITLEDWMGSFAGLKSAGENR